jgi:2-keto-myo-inositol isomerase
MHLGKGLHRVAGAGVDVGDQLDLAGVQFLLDRSADLAKPLEHCRRRIRLMPGDGIVPFGELFDVFSHIGDDDVMSIELFNPEIWEWDAEKAVRTAKEKCDSVIRDYLKNFL